MTRPMQIVGLGQRAAGDDAAGLAVVDALRAAGLEAIELADPSLLVAVLGEGAVVLVDAVIAPPPGRVLALQPAELARGRRATSSHGFTAADAIELARVLEPASLERLHVVAITIEPPVRGRLGLSASVTAAVPIAVAKVRALVLSTV